MHTLMSALCYDGYLAIHWDYDECGGQNHNTKYWNWVEYKLKKNSICKMNIEDWLINRNKWISLTYMIVIACNVGRSNSGMRSNSCIKLL